MKALIVEKRYLDLILNGSKTWEMRSKNCLHRGDMALIEKGSGTVVGVVNIVDSGPEVPSLAAYAIAEPMHRIPSAKQGAAFDGKWVIPWVLKNPRRLAKPVRYIHKKGQQSRFELDPDVAIEVEGQLRGS